jgi:CheY-like chemotaxis protein
MNKNYTIFIIDDKVENLKYLKEIIRDENYTIKATTDASFALESIATVIPDLILLDIKMPQINGFELCKQIKKNINLKDIPIIFISALDDVDSKVKAFEEGGVDYITKPFEQKEVKARIKTQLTISENRNTITNLLKQQDFFLKKIIHEMNTPLSIITLNTNSLEDEFGAKDEFNSLKASCKSLSSIYEDLYYLSKKEKREIEKIKINILEFISKRVNFFHELADIKAINLELHIDDNFYALLDTYELERVIDNTLSNAIKYSYENSTVDIFIENKCIKIQNIGDTISTENDVFEAFYQEKENQGFGLGLNIIKDICTKNKIKINLTSNKNYTEFSYDFSNVLIE